MKVQRMVVLLFALAAAADASAVTNGVAGSRPPVPEPKKAPVASAIPAPAAKPGSDAMPKFRQNAALIKEFLEKDEWHCDEEIEEERVVFSGALKPSEDSPYNSFRYLLTVADDIVQSYIIPPVTVGAKNRPLMAEFTTRANYGLKYGNFEMDYRDGELRYHMALPIEAFRADRDRFVKMILLAPALTVDRYAKGIAAVLIGAKTPEEAVGECKNED